MTVTKKIGSIKFSCVSPDEIRKLSAVKVITADTYNDEGRPIDGGLMDPRMGVIEQGAKCKTCDCKVDECPGHFGHIDLAMPVIHVGFISDIKIMFDCFCRSCGRILVDGKTIEDLENRVKVIHELGDDPQSVKDHRKHVQLLTKNVLMCPWCGSERLLTKLDKPTTFREEADNHKLTPKEVREFLEHIPDFDLEAMLYDTQSCRPEWMVLTALPVPPITVRPSITLDSGERSEDDLTHKLVDILRINQRLRENRDNGAPQLIVEDLWELMQYHITTYFDNQTAGIPPARHRSGRPLKTLTQRLKGKEGRFRSNLSGKRVNFSARTVISPDPNLSINQVGVPIPVSRELSVPMHVNEGNIDEARIYVRFGIEPTEARVREIMSTLDPAYPGYEVQMRTCENALRALSVGARYQFGVNGYVRGKDGKRVRFLASDTTTSIDGQLVIDSKAERICVGDSIERQLKDGDIVLFNRQPSLHRMSIMAHRVRVMQGKTFRFNLCVCAPYNADFDGDEMNLHALQSEEARAEARILMLVQENILSPKNGGPIIGGIHDHISGSFLLTHARHKLDRDGRFLKDDAGNYVWDERRFGRWEAMNILMKLPDIEPPECAGYFEEDCRLGKKGEPYWTGRQLFSLCLPEDLNLTFRSSVQKNLEEDDPDNDGPVVIQNGQLISGTVDENGVGNTKGQILERVARDYGASRAEKFLHDVTRLALATVMDLGFSTGISDEDIPSDDVREIRAICDEGIRDVDDLISSYKDGTYDSSRGGTKEENLELDIASRLSRARTEIGNVAGKSLGMSNSAVIMAKTGARGSMNNLTQMAGCVGQQNIRGDRIKRGYAYRTLPHFERNDLGAYAKGFCANSYKDGLTPTEFFFHAMGGREGLVDTAVRTSRSGYMQRRLVSALEDLKLMSDGSVRRTDGTIVQFRYGDDGIDPSRAARGSAVNVDDLLMEVLGADAAASIIKPADVAGTSYGSRDELGDVEDVGDAVDSEDEDGESDDYGDESDDYEGGE